MISITSNLTALKPSGEKSPKQQSVRVVFWQWHCILSAELKTHSFRLLCWRFCPLEMLQHKKMTSSKRRQKQNMIILKRERERTECMMNSYVNKKKITKVSLHTNNFTTVLNIFPSLIFYLIVVEEDRRLVYFVS